MSGSIEELVYAIHNTQTRMVLIVAGGGSRAISALTEAPGASRTVLEAIVPYSESAVKNVLGRLPEQLCSDQAARQMAVVAMLRAMEYGGPGASVVGVSCTASLTSDRPKRGHHRFHISLQADDRTSTWSLTLHKGRRTRMREEMLTTGAILNVVADGCGLDERLDLDLFDGERIERIEVRAKDEWRELFLGHIKRVRCGGELTDSPKAIFPGAFNPIHAGHRRMIQIAQQKLGYPVDIEVSITNVDKPTLDYREIEYRLGQFESSDRIWLTRASTFEEKSELFPDATFIVGVDTILRIAEVRYYDGDSIACETAIKRIADRGCRFLVFGRDDNGQFLGLTEVDLPDSLRAICSGVSGDEFREDISSTELRHG